MTEEGDDQIDKKNPLVKKLILEVGKPVEIDTEGLGWIVARWLTLKGAVEFERRVKDVYDTLTDDALVREYIGCVSGIPIDGSNDFPPFLSEEQVDRLTIPDLKTFAAQYLEKVAEQPSAEGPVPELAKYIRQETAEHRESTKKLMESIKSINMAASSQILKNWGGLDDMLGNKVPDFAKSLKNTYGSLFAANDRLGDSIRKITEAGKPFVASDPVRKILAGVERSEIGCANDLLASRGTLTPVVTPNFDFAKIARNSPTTRTARAVESLDRAAAKMARGVDALLEHAGTATLDIEGVLDTIQTEAGKSGKEARKALRISIGTAILATAISVVGIWISHRDTVNNDAAMRQAKATEEQNELLKSLLDETRKQKVSVITMKPESTPAPVPRHKPTPSVPTGR